MSRSRSVSGDVAQGRREARAHQKHKIPTKQYTSKDWRRMQDIITQLYCEDKVTVAELIRRLHGMGFEVNERMLHTRIRKWKIGRNHKSSEMRMAAHLLAEFLDQQQQQSNASGSGPSVTTGKRTMPSFDIRGERVSYNELMRYFRRKKIADPVCWVKEQKDGLDLSEDVVIVVNADPVSVGQARSSEDASDSEHEEFELFIEQVEQTASGHVADNSHITCPMPNEHCLDEGYSTWVGGLPHTNITSSSFSVPTLFRPQSYYAIEQLNQNMMLYMSSYLSSPASKSDQEPVVHAHTVHAIFASKMQDGISLLGNVSPHAAELRRRHPDTSAVEAFSSFRNGFLLVENILKDPSPMSLTLMLSIICDLAVRAAKPSMMSSHVGVILVKLLEYIREMAAAPKVCGPGHPLTGFFDILAREYSSPTVLSSSGSQPVIELILNSLNLALAQLDRSYTSSSPTTLARAQDWKQLYVRERLCDALYYCGSSYQAARLRMRRRLFHDQEARYGRTARNVLWTLTNVADDCLADGDVDQAIGYFQDALDRAETLVDDYGRAKSSFAAREGLGRCWMRKAEKAEAEALWQEEQSRGRVRAENLFGPGHTSLDRNPQTSPNSTCCSCHCHSSSGSHPASSESSTDNTGTSTPTSSGSSTSSSPLQSSQGTRSQGPTGNHHLHQHNSRNRHPDSPAHKRVQYLRKAYGYFVDAEDEARTYFEASSRRITRVSARRQEVADLLGIVATPESSTCSGSGSGSEDEGRGMSADGGRGGDKHQSGGGMLF
ncbi:uncharacterized protein Z520_07991 [Fonsecaea multimorphosa CBS 102226]|uniref:Clr5 domain-containing protein n=1 Tax=Fonsecaea multimorphosa CBS 102226 TaxID=1442371 RepID=A0A0D2KHR2_9EURO|nr:uncharacterized protein Z520_07991 [Fonsecaea multimorphosa CBS 102226]KIX96213.1 hypothetical protein Z520_07991 [Fonsecaea multimorphosa CBS 102226]OAL22210.1 hypothetical protein AYO22_07254 [Fonsecaea multimorphosa]